MSRKRRTTTKVHPRPGNGTAATVTAARSLDADGIQRAVQAAISSGEIVSVGVLNLVKNTLVVALAGARDVGGEIGAAAVTAVRGSIKAANEIGADLGTVAKHAIIGTIEAAEAIGGELSGVAKSASRGAVRATGEVGGDVGKVARKAVEGTAEAARNLGVDVRKLVTGAAQGAIEAADRIGSAAGRSVRATLSEAKSGITALVGAPKSAPRQARHPRGAGRPVAAPRRRRNVEAPAPAEKLTVSS